MINYRYSYLSSSALIFTEVFLTHQILEMQIVRCLMIRFLAVQNNDSITPQTGQNFDLIKKSLIFSTFTICSVKAGIF